MPAKTIFKRIIDGEVPANIVYQDEHCLAFHDVNPQAPVHVLVIPRKEIASLADLTPEDEQLAGRLLLAAGKIAAELGLVQGYRVVINNGEQAGQSVPHLHLHLLGGRVMKWPPG